MLALFCLESVNDVGRHFDLVLVLLIYIYMYMLAQVSVPELNCTALVCYIAALLYLCASQADTCPGAEPMSVVAIRLMLACF